MSAYCSLRMMLKPPVAFFLPEPESVLSDEDVRDITGRGYGRERVLRLLWALYCRCVLSQADPCMEPGEGAEAVFKHIRPNTCLSVERAGTGCFVLKRNGKELYLEDAEDGGLMLYFLPPDKCWNRTDACRLELGDYSPDAAALFIAAAFGAFGMVREYISQKCS